MFDSSIKQNTNIQTEIPYRDKFPTMFVDIQDIKINSIPENLSWLEDENKQVVINDNITLVVHKDLVGLITKGYHKIWYHRPDKFDRYVKFIMIEG